MSTNLFSLVGLQEILTGLESNGVVAHSYLVALTYLSLTDNALKVVTAVCNYPAQF